MQLTGSFLRRPGSDHITRTSIHEALRGSDASSITDQPRPLDPNENLPVSSINGVLYFPIIETTTEPESPSSLIAKSSIASFKGHSIEEPSDSVFQDMRDFLALLYTEEKPSLDETPEYTLPLADRTQLEPAMDTEVLNPIRLGLGPRPSDKEMDDLVAGLRQHARPERNEDLEEPMETYEELIEILQGWNIRVCPGVEDEEARKELLNALDDRQRLIDAVLHKKHDIRDVHEQCSSLIQALHKYRPETTTFVDQRPYSIMVSMIANHRVAKPTIDVDIWNAMFKVLLMELQLQLPEHMLETERLIDQKLKSKEFKENKEERNYWRQEDNAHFQARCTWTAKRLLDDLKMARKNLRFEVLTQLQELTMLQAGGRWCLSRSGREAAPHLHQQNCEAAETALAQVVLEQYSVLEEQLAASTSNVESMRTLAKQSLARGRKIEGKDVVDLDERKRVIKERRNSAATTIMMMKAHMETSELGELSRRTLRKLDIMEMALHELHEAAVHLYKEYAEWLHETDEGVDPIGFP